MCVYVGRSAEITVAQPFLHTLKRYSARYQQACTTVPEIVKTYLLKTMLGQKLRKLTAKIIRTNQISHLSVIVRVSVLRGLVFPIIDQQPEQKNNNKRDNKA